MRRTYTLFALLATLAGCSLGTGTEATGSGVIVLGRVDTEAGIGVPGVQIRVGYTPMDTCGTTVVQGVNGPTTDSSGSYGIPIVDGGAPRTVCMKIVATPPAILPLAPDSLLRLVPLTALPNVDSVRMDLVLPPR